jgi:hypothetical protein
MVDSRLVPAAATSSSPQPGARRRRSASRGLRVLDAGTTLQVRKSTDLGLTFGPG